jgi:tetratricopeptide (TPR) repeat protein
LELLKKIAEIHHDAGIKTRLHLHGDLFVTGLKDKMFDCGNYILTYLSIAEMLKLPIYAVDAPGHILLHFFDSDSCNFFWETLYECEMDSLHYIKNNHISNQALEKNIYLRNLNNNEIFSDRNITLSVILANDKLYDKSLKYADSSIKLNPETPATYCAKGSVYFKLANYEKASEYFHKALGIDSLYAIALSDIGALYLSQGKYDSALVYINKSISIDSLNDISFQNRAKIYLNKNEFKEALDDINYSIAISEEYGNISSELYKIKGDILYKLGKFNEAIEQFTLAININPNDKYAFNNRGLSFCSVEKYDSAIDDWNSAMKIDSTIPEPIANLGRYYFYITNDFEKTIPVFLQTLKLDSSMADIYHLLALSYYYTDKNSESIDWFNKYFGKNPQDIPAYLGRGDAYMELDKCDSAYSDYQKVYIAEGEEHTIDCINDMIYCKIFCNKLEQVAELIKEGLVIEPSDNNLILNRLYFYLLENKTKEANHIFKNKIINNDDISEEDLLKDLDRLKKTYPENKLIDIYIQKIKEQ